MKYPVRYYRSLMTQFVEGDISGQKFTEEYLNSFKQDSTNWDDDVFSVLDAVFGMADCYISDPDALSRIRATESNPEFWLGDDDLKQGVMKAIKKLKSIR